MKGETAMKRRAQKILRIFTAGILTVVVAAAAVTESGQMLLAREKSEAKRS